MTHAPVGFLALWLLGACGSAVLPPANHAHFDAIQRQETRIDIAIATSQDELQECDEREHAAVEGRAAAARICSIADQVADGDAALRCRAAQERTQNLAPLCE